MRKRLFSTLIALAAATSVCAVQAADKNLLKKGAEGFKKGTESVVKGTAKGAEAAGKGTLKATEAAGKGAVKATKAAGKGTLKGAEAIGKGAVKATKAAGKGTIKGVESLGKGTFKSSKDENKKIGAIGIRVKKWVAYHGFSININNDLEYFKKIIPCGVRDKRVVSLKDISKVKYTDFLRQLEKKLVKNLSVSNYS